MAISLRTVLLPLPDSPMKIVSGLISLILTSDIGPKFRIKIDSFIIVMFFQGLVICFLVCCLNKTFVLFYSNFLCCFIVSRGQINDHVPSSECVPLFLTRFLEFQSFRVLDFQIGFSSLWLRGEQQTSFLLSLPPQGMSVLSFLNKRVFLYLSDE